MLFRVRKALIWDGKQYEPGEMVEIQEGNPRIRPLVEQSHHLEYANRDKPSEVQGTPIRVETEIG
jgi:hypothetical protein